ncbi:hypothetical protein TSUD_332650 [Trifolium subterraneum]|uniref:Major facilitator superfamily (MFS) profile domain-containing protein n=1 Tax=Trifolium subterraneum TaxID=3900 RepID=A0A2Z6N5Z7_TRISU|nr:hypothetical protein TSUD_332650 [Trifolium subterraneum]
MMLLLSFKLPEKLILLHNRSYLQIAKKLRKNCRKVLSWRALAIIGLIPTAVLLLGLFFIPESPRWLAKRGRAKDFVAALQVLRGKDADISQEAKEIQIVITGVGAALIDKAGRKPLLLVSGSGLVAFYLKVHDVAVGAVPALALTGILVYIGSFSIGMGAIPRVVMSETKDAS